MLYITPAVHPPKNTSGACIANYERGACGASDLSPGDPSWVKSHPELIKTHFASKGRRKVTLGFFSPCLFPFPTLCLAPGSTGSRTHWQAELPGPHAGLLGCPSRDGLQGGLQGSRRQGWQVETPLPMQRPARLAPSACPAHLGGLWALRLPSLRRALQGGRVGLGSCSRGPGGCNRG